MINSSYEPNSTIFKIQADTKRKISALKEEVRKLNILRKKQKIQKEHEQSL